MFVKYNKKFSKKYDPFAPQLNFKNSAPVRVPGPTVKKTPIWVGVVLCELQESYKT